MRDSLYPMLSSVCTYPSVEFDPLYMMGGTLRLTEDGPTPVDLSEDNYARL